MNKPVWVLCSVLCLGLFSTAAWAHPPTDLKLSYDESRQILRVRMKHVTQNPLKHQIHQIRISKSNDTVESWKTFSKQSSPSEFDQEISLSAQPGDVIRVTAYCNKGGMLSSEVAIPKPEEKTAASGENQTKE